MEYNIYCDESCHLENDHQKAMVLGAVWCPREKTRQIFEKIRSIKIQHNLNKNYEIKWTKVSPAKIKFYHDLIDYFFDNNDLHFRALIIPDKLKIRHKDFGQEHDTWYYKMYFNMLKNIFRPPDRYRIYLDIKDTCSSQKIKKLHEILSNNIYDFSRDIIERVQTVRSNEIEILQITDLLTGAVSYISRDISDSPTKLSIVDKIKQRSGYSLKGSTLVREEKFNLFFWQAKDENE